MHNKYTVYCRQIIVVLRFPNGKSRAYGGCLGFVEAMKDAV